MPMQFEKDQIILTGEVGVEDAETLLGWLQQTTQARVDMSACEHLHTANIQVLAAANARVVAWPKEIELSKFLQTILANKYQ